MRWLWWLLAYTSLGLGIVGIAVPGLPTVPFVLLAAFAAARGSQRLHDWLLAHRRFGPMIGDWEREGAVSRRAKRLATAAADIEHMTPAIHDDLRDHVIVIGFGRVGSELARLLAARGVTVLVVDDDGDRIAQARAAGFPASRGNAAHAPAVLRDAVQSPDGDRRSRRVCEHRTGDRRRDGRRQLFLHAGPAAADQFRPAI